MMVHPLHLGVVFTFIFCSVFSRKSWFPTRLIKILTNRYKSLTLVNIYDHLIGMQPESMAHHIRLLVLHSPCKCTVLRVLGKS